MIKANAAHSEIIVANTSQNNESELPSPYTMTEDTLRKRLEHENKGRYITQLCAAVSASLAALSFGTTLGWSSPVTDYLSESVRFNLTDDHYGWIASLMPLGCSVGSIIWTYTINKMGPKHTLIMQIPFYILIYLLVITVKTYNMYLVGRFFSGFVTISNMIGGECLLMDSVHPGHLPHMIVFFRSSVLLGVLLSYVIGYYSTKFWLTAVCVGVPTLNAIILLFLPESPVFLYERSEKKAENSLRWYRGRANIYTELRSIKKDAEVRKVGSESYRYMLFSKVVSKALLIVLGLTFFQVFSGYYVFIFYNLIIWKSSVIDPFTDALIFGLCLYISNFIGSMVHYNVHLFGVRKSLILSSSLTAISLTIISLYFFLIEHHILHVQTLRWIPVAALNSFVVSYEVGLSTYADLLLFDYLPFQIHVQAKTITRSCIWVQIFVLTKYFTTLKSLTSYCIAFATLAVISYIGIMYCYVFIIETKGKNLIEIQIEIGGNPIGNRGAYRNRIGPSRISDYIM